MEKVPQHEEVIEKLVIFMDSRSVLEACEAPENERHSIIITLLHTAESLKSSGTKVKLLWVTSHVGITDNEKLDLLVSTESSYHSRQQVKNNILSTAEQSTIFKNYLKELDLETKPQGHKRKYTC